MRGVAALFSGWRGLGRFWTLISLGLFVGTAALQIIGPPLGAKTAGGHNALGNSPATQTVDRREKLPEPVVLHPAAPTVAMQGERPGRDEPGVVNDPEPGLLEPAPGSPSDTLPRIAEDGRKPMRYYAAGFDPTSIRPRVGLLVAGIGLSVADSRKAIVDLPAQVTLALPAYVTNPEPLLSLARLRGHEYLLSIPMEPVRFPLNDPWDPLESTCRHASLSIL